MLTAEAVRITKIEAAHNQLRTACILWFADTDHVSVHALAYAAHEIIHRIYRKLGHSDLLFDSLIIKDEYRSDFAKLLKGSANFFKHANREFNADDSIEFNPLMNVLLLMMSINGLQRIGKPIGAPESAFMFWLYLHNPSWFPDSVANGLIPVDHLDQMRSIRKEEFFQAYLAVRRDMEASQ